MQLCMHERLQCLPSLHERCRCGACQAFAQSCQRLPAKQQRGALTLVRILFQSSTNFSVQRSTMVVVCSGEGSFARYGP